KRTEKDLRRSAQTAQRTGSFQSRAGYLIADATLTRRMRRQRIGGPLEALHGWPQKLSVCVIAIDR
ncbi:hypothetical protein, partial [Paraburkholderia hospita]|uniref:hypothetical protein n=1 Tax=Paraburkholderia hospita TaxID=169430 RepID=UPI001A98ED2A